jgi:hypothetical protein
MQYSVISVECKETLNFWLNSTNQRKPGASNDIFDIEMIHKRSYKSSATFHCNNYKRGHGEKRRAHIGISK